MDRRRAQPPGPWWSRPRIPRVPGWLLAALALAAPAAVAVQALRLTLGDVDATGWRAEGAEAVVTLGRDGVDGFQLSVARLVLPAPLGEWSEVRLSCARGALLPRGARCEDARVEALSSLLGPVRGAAAFEVTPAEQSVTVSGLTTAGGLLSAELARTGAAWSVDARLEGADAAELVRLAAVLGAGLDLDVSGPVTLTLSAKGRGQVPAHADVAVRADGLTFSNADGTRAGEGVRGRVTLRAAPAADGWRLDGSARADAGQVYIDPLYLEIPDAGLDVEARGRWGEGALSVERLKLSHPRVLQARLEGPMTVYPAPAWERLRVTLDRARLPAGYTTFVQPWLAGTLGGDLDPTGNVTGSLVLQGRAPVALDLTLTDVGVSDRLGRFAVAGLNADVSWRDEGAPRAAEVSWREAGFYRVPVGAADLALSVGPRAVALRRPADIPVVDGGLHIDTLRLGTEAGAGVRWDFDGYLTPLSLAELTDALGWPPLAGQLSGMIPDVSYRDGKLEVGGTLLARAFNGEITVRALRMEEPLGLVPRLSADIGVDDLDLEILTRTFSFGKIEGRLGGHVRDLRLEQWRPAAFDARLATPPDDDSRHRISQRALDTLSSIGGGGVGGALSRSFLRVFEDFPYERLGISCRLRNGVCDMGGVGPAEGEGYYIVKGRWLPPRVNVIGYAREVDWDTLVSQLQAATQGTAPAVGQ